MSIYIYKDDQQVGRYSVEQIRFLLQEGMMIVGDLVWADGLTSYIPIENVSDLVDSYNDKSNDVPQHTTLSL